MLPPRIGSTRLVRVRLLGAGLTLNPSHLAGLALYVTVTALVFVESGLLVGFFLPGDTVLFAAGLAAAAPSTHVDIGLLVALVVAAAVLGDGTAYLMGARAGRPLLLRRTGRVLNAANLARAEAFYARFGAPALVAARFIPWMRVFVPVLAGASAMRYRDFVVFNVLGALGWGAGLLVLGYWAASVPGLKHAAVGVAVAVVVGSIVVGGVLARRRGRGGR